MQDILGGLKTRRQNTWHKMKDLVEAAEKRSEWSDVDEKRYSDLTDELSQVDQRIGDIEANEKRQPS